MTIQGLKFPNLPVIKEFPVFQPIRSQIAKIIDLFLDLG